MTQTGFLYWPSSKSVDDSFKIGFFNVCLAPGTTQAEVVEDLIDIPVGGRTNYSGCATHSP